MTPICACGKEVSPEKLAQIKKAFNERENDMPDYLQEFRDKLRHLCEPATHANQPRVIDWKYQVTKEGMDHISKELEVLITRIHTEAYAEGYARAVEDIEKIVKETKWDEYWTKGTCGEEGRMHNRDVEVVLGQLQSLKHK